ncbi:MAG: zinc ribbon domain-containing protein [Chloroflexi bacterium]|nr:zinc ribbon domain-containing protein [Chloroflexota bacterium]
MKNRTGKLSQTHLWLVGTLCLCLFILNVQAVVAQTPVPPADQSDAVLTIQQLRVQVMPEFDDPRVLLIIQGRLDASDAAFPLPITFRVPRGAQINQMAVMDISTGATTSQPFDAQPDPSDPRWSLVTYTVDNAHFFYEYYYDPIEGETDKQFTYAFSSLQPINDFSVEIQQPLAATDFTLDPPPTILRFDEAFGFTYHRFNMDALAANDELMITVNYTKAASEPSLSREQVMGMQGNDVPSEMPAVMGVSHATSSSVPEWAFVLLGVTILVIGGGFVWNRTQPGNTPIKAMAPRVSINPTVSKAESLLGFCTQCGATLKSGAHFCHICGIPCKVAQE